MIPGPELSRGSKGAESRPAELCSVQFLPADDGRARERSSLAKAGESFIRPACRTFGTDIHVS